MRACATSSLPVFVLWMRTRATGPSAGTSPASIANGPTPAEMLPQLLVKTTRPSPGGTMP